MVSILHDTTEAHPQDESILTGLAQNADSVAYGVECDTAINATTKAEAERLLEAVLDSSNLRQAYRRVVDNKGAAGVDNVSVLALNTHLQTHWPCIRETLLQGRYRPQAVRAVAIPKANGGTRTLGIPTVVDRFIQQA